MPKQSFFTQMAARRSSIGAAADETQPSGQGEASFVSAGTSTMRTGAASAADLSRIAAQFDVTDISSRQLIEMGNQLKAAGALGLEEHAMLAFQPELNPTYDFVGAQHVRRPDPDQPRNALEEWRRILQTQESFDLSATFLSVTRRIVDTLEQLAALRGKA